MKTSLSRAIAEVVRRELAGRQVSAADFAATIGRPKTTTWRKIEGASKMSIDDVEEFAHGLGWTLPQLVARGAEIQKQQAAADPIRAELEGGLSSSNRRALEDIRPAERDEDREDPPAPGSERGRHSA